MPFVLRHRETLMRRMPDPDERFAALRMRLAQPRVRPAAGAGAAKGPPA